jgi:hypothetical protein
MICETRVSALALLLLCAPALAWADAIYQYAGNPFDNTNAPGSWTLVPEAPYGALSAFSSTLLAAAPVRRLKS